VVAAHAALMSISRSSVAALGIGVVVGALLAVAGYIAMAIAVDRLFPDSDRLDVTVDEVQLAAINAHVRTFELPAGARVTTVIEYGGPGCGGAVEVKVWDPSVGYAASDPLSTAVYLVHQDSGDALASRSRGSLAGARALLAGTQGCFD
jgi:hypothetical protein